MNPISDRVLAWLKRVSGCTILEVCDYAGPTGAPRRAIRVSCPTHQARVKLLDALAWVDAVCDPRVRELAMLVAQSAPEGRWGYQWAIHDFVKRAVRYVREGTETFTDTWITIETGVGDCDDSSRAVAALARSLKIPAKLGTFGDPPAHVVALLGEKSRPGKFVFAEATIDAHLGEHPFKALKRLGKDLSDVA